jgi:hypothetical protein
LFQKHGTFNFGYQFWFLGPTINIFIKLMLCNFILFFLKFILYIEGSINIFMVYIGIIGPMLSHFDCTNFKVLLVIKIINFNENLKNSPSSHACHLPCECDYLSKNYLPHIYRIFNEKIQFWNENFQSSHMVSKHGLNNVKWHGSIYLQLS